jgi:hypothetical protein
MRNEKPGWCRPRKPCPACADIDNTGLSYLEHTCGIKPLKAPHGAWDALTGGCP